MRVNNPADQPQPSSTPEEDRISRRISEEIGSLRHRIETESPRRFLRRIRQVNIDRTIFQDIGVAVNPVELMCLKYLLLIVRPNYLDAIDTYPDLSSRQLIRLLDKEFISEWVGSEMLSNMVAEYHRSTPSAPEEVGENSAGARKRKAESGDDQEGTGSGHSARFQSQLFISHSIKHSAKHPRVGRDDAGASSSSVSGETTQAIRSGENTEPSLADDATGTDVAPEGSEAGPNVCA